jgi:hypothetical protein
MPASPAGPRPGAAALLERALPQDVSPWTLETSATRWLASTSLETRSAALAIARGPLRTAAGLSQTGDPDLGWTSAALAAGTCARDGGAALRVVARRDRAAGALREGGLARGVALEAGAGGWLAPSPELVLWASAPQLYGSGPAPPLVRPLEIGARIGGDDLSAWCALEAPRGGDDGERSAGLSLGLGPGHAWAEARDDPLRASLGLLLELRGLRIETRADLHPVLGETTRVVLAWHGRERAGAP